MTTHTTLVTIAQPRLIAQHITVHAASTVALVPRDGGSNDYMALLVDGAYYDLVMTKHISGRPEIEVALQAALAQVQAAIAALTPTSDMPIATPAQILARAVELRADAVLAHDATTVRALDRVIVALTCGAQAWWADGDLCVTSINSPGVIYALSCGVCSCEARKPCWHMALLDLILDIQDTAAGDADLEADADDDADESGATTIQLDITRPAPAATPAPLRLSDYAIRRFVLIPALRRTAAFLASLRTHNDPPAPEPNPLGDEPGDTCPDEYRARTAHGRRLARARTASSYARPLFAERDAEDARLAAKGELRAQLEVVQARRAARVATQAMNELY